MHLPSELGAFIRASLVHRVQGRREKSPTQVRRRRIVVTITLLLGAAGLGAALDVAPGEPLFYVASLGVAAIWTIGAFASGPLSRGRSWTREGKPGGRAVVQGLILGGSLLAVFFLGAMVVGQVDFLRGPVDDLLEHAHFGNIAIVAAVTAISGIGEELFFRGAVFAAMPRRWEIIGSALIYTLSTVLSGVPLLSFAALCLGLLTGAQRRVTGGVLGPIVSHLTWSLGMLFLLPSALSIGDLLW
ncbi:MAG: lysostaphin resistance A-like protein [Flaviflexus sp.]|uniref:CPBP family intramembrane glutamic endopeptidase n=1 Tax=Flaviflexus sp. TaxID=1969482 RepID=UPI003F8F8743